MPAFDPRRPSYCVAPQLALGALGTVAVCVGFHLVAIGLGSAACAAIKPPSVRTVALKGALRPRQQTAPVGGDTLVAAAGRMQGSLYQSVERLGATPAITAQVVKLFSHKLDFARDIRPGDTFRLVFDRKAADSGRATATGDLKYAEIGAKGQVTRVYGFKAPGSSQLQYFDELGKSIKGFLLRTPVDGGRVTSGFGMRLHPILGYTRMHQGVDFGVPVGTPVYAAGDGVVEEARWAGGYGRWLKLKHTDGWETAYGHLSGWAVKPGQHVRQGQVVAYTGSSGESTGPHLHYEVIDRGVKVNPKSAKAPSGTILAGRLLAAFNAEKARVDAMIADADRPHLAQMDVRVPIRGG